MAKMLEKIKQTFELIRFSHTIFALPFALASMLVAAEGLPEIRIIVLILVSMVLARTSAMAFNRFVDAKIDARNPRTVTRHIPAGLLSRPYVLTLAITTGLGFIAATHWLNPLAFALSPLALIIIWFYSITKRFTHWTQLFLGLALAISPIGAWIAVTGRLEWPPIILGLAVLFWVAGFDIFYATQDHDFDREQGMKSLIVRFGLSGAIRLARIFHLLTVIFLLGFVVYVPTPLPYLLACAIVIAVLAYENSLVRAHDLSRIDQAFFALNGWVGIIFLVGTAIAVFPY